ncbi:MAG: hypothetical protein R3E08_02135 [Thiotrichaceae bacterium]
MSEEGVIRGTTLGTGHGGTIHLHIAESLTISGQSRPAFQV